MYKGKISPYTLAIQFRLLLQQFPYLFQIFIGMFQLTGIAVDHFDHIILIQCLPVFQPARRQKIPDQRNASRRHLRVYENLLIVDRAAEIRSTCAGTPCFSWKFIFFSPKRCNFVKIVEKQYRAGPALSEPLYKVPE